VKASLWLQHVDAALSVLPARLTSGAARAMLVAIALQESDLRHRRQIGGPALSYLMWEPGEDSALPGVLKHPATKDMARDFIAALDYTGLDAEELRQATVYDCTLSAGLGRLLLYTLPMALPQRHDSTEAWGQYMQAWRPGKGKPERWLTRWLAAWELIS